MPPKQRQSVISVRGTNVSHAFHVVHHIFASHTRSGGSCLPPVSSDRNGGDINRCSEGYRKSPRGSKKRRWRRAQTGMGGSNPIRRLEDQQQPNFSRLGIDTDRRFGLSSRLVYQASRLRPLVRTRNTAMRDLPIQSEKRSNAFIDSSPILNFFAVPALISGVHRPCSTIPRH